jgi:hypothetical protein
LENNKNSYDEGDVEELRDYPLSNTEIAERGVKRGISQSERAVCC